MLYLKKEIKSQTSWSIACKSLVFSDPNYYHDTPSTNEIIII